MLGKPLALEFGDIYKTNQRAGVVQDVGQWWEHGTDLAPSPGHVFGKYRPEEITHLSPPRGEQHLVREKSLWGCFVS